ncbi:MAG: TRAP transporter small permease [Marinosulfonomonas sp.]|nr:TRAP transporter small permease [Marinosulfonomonas sp.]
MERIIQSADRNLRKIEWLFAILGGVALIVLMCIGSAQVVARSVFQAPIHGILDIIEQLMVPVAAMAIAYCQSHFGNVRMTLLVSNKASRRKWMQEVFTYVIAVFVVGVFLQGSWANFVRAWVNGGDTPEIGIPIWITILIVTASLGLLFLRVLLQLIEAGRLVATPNSPTQVFEQELQLLETSEL